MQLQCIVFFTRSLLGSRNGVEVLKVLTDLPTASRSVLEIAAWMIQPCSEVVSNLQTDSAVPLHHQLCPRLTPLAGSAARRNLYYHLRGLHTSPLLLDHQNA